MNYDEVNMKPMLSKVVQEALRLAIIDCCSLIPSSRSDCPHGCTEPVTVVTYNDKLVKDECRHGHKVEDCEREATDEEKEGWLHDIYTLPQEAWNRIDQGALGQNLACRLFGVGGWSIGDVYAGNATPAEMFMASFSNPGVGGIDDVIHGLRGQGFDARPMGPPKPMICPECDGQRGEEVKDDNTPNSPSLWITCSTCDGKGVVPDDYYRQPE